jgi:hypothetical protein
MGIEGIQRWRGTTAPNLAALAKGHAPVEPDLE